MWSLTLWMTFYVFMPFIWGFWAHFHWIALMPKYTKTGITQLSDGLGTWVRPHLTRKVEVSTFNGFLCMTILLWFEVFASNVPKLPQFPKYSTTDDLETWLRHHLMWNFKLKTLNYLYVSFPMTWGIYAQIS